MNPARASSIFNGSFCVNIEAFYFFPLDEIRDIMSSYSLVTSTVLRRRARNENLSVLRIARRQ
jgi:hypothetical protein